MGQYAISVLATEASRSLPVIPGCTAGPTVNLPLLLRSRSMSKKYLVGLNAVFLVVPGTKVESMNKLAIVEAFEAHPEMMADLRLRILHKIAQGLSDIYICMVQVYGHMLS